MLEVQRRLVVQEAGRCTRTLQFDADRVTVSDGPHCAPALAGSFARDPRRSPFENE
ncbi:hypothetical protein [uncultured Variovorax sp.]|uniref:hypothetical protein n=1 Tax=uncultured Variovorax sp. TaxID=114708 RepID=UPI0025E5CEE1|nr:hypothetical protein [uncultured Variovorax sp.]